MAVRRNDQRRRSSYDVFDDVRDYLEENPRVAVDIATQAGLNSTMGLRNIRFLISQMDPWEAFQMGMESHDSFYEGDDLFRFTESGGVESLSYDEYEAEAMDNLDDDILSDIVGLKYRIPPDLERIIAEWADYEGDDY